jgi:aspartate/methionine/tyrosine aminotransferase
MLTCRNAAGYVESRLGCTESQFRYPRKVIQYDLGMFSKRTDWGLSANRFTQAQSEIRASNIELIDLTVSNPTATKLPYDAETILESLMQPGSLVYDPQPKGMQSARDAIVRYYREDHGVFGLSPEALILTASTSEGYSFAFRLLCNPQDEVLVPKPSYPLFDFLADLHDISLVPYPLLYDHGWQIDFPSLYKAVNHRTRAVVIVHPNNPTGSYASENERKALNRFCREFGLAIIVDEVFLDYAHDGSVRSSFASNTEVLTLTLSGLSKISALPQMKAAWMAVTGPEEQASAALNRLEVIADTFLSVSTPIQLALPSLLEQRKKVRPVLLDRLRANREVLDRALTHQKTCSRLEVDGGWYAVLRVPSTESDEEIAIDLMRRGAVLVHPGHFYDFVSEGHLILSLIPPTEEFREGAERMLHLLNRD